ncbi:MAG: helix-turn-helix transcriptional regulator [Deltaproteobacteria bacterium]|nr:helix-turn-helix transcriptional regulator [Deltaproteobacteria bacterium]MBI3387508.1 helix-turn-helix transcriptional regulator [Deltaproteobacteria bacterium]
MAKRRSNELSLGAVLKRRRRQLEMTQSQVSDKVGCRANYIAYLESDARRPSHSVVAKLARALDLDQQELYFLAYPQAKALMRPERPEPESAWLRFKANKRLHVRHSITRGEFSALERVASLGAVRTQRDFLFILQTIRQALTDE